MLIFKNKIRRYLLLFTFIIISSFACSIYGDDGENKSSSDWRFYVGKLKNMTYSTEGFSIICLNFNDNKLTGIIEYDSQYQPGGACIGEKNTKNILLKEKNITFKLILNGKKLSGRYFVEKTAQYGEVTYIEVPAKDCKVIYSILRNPNQRELIQSAYIIKNFEKDLQWKK